MTQLSNDHPWDALLYVECNLAQGVHIMATSDAPEMRDRVYLAYMKFHPIFAFGERLAEPLAGTLRVLRARMTGAGGALTTLRALSDGEVRRIAHAICDAATDAVHELRRLEVKMAEMRGAA